MTQKEMVINHLDVFDSITPAEAIQEYGIYRLAAVVYDLKNEGYNIQTDIITSINRFGNPVHFASYSFIGD